MPWELPAGPAPQIGQSRLRPRALYIALVVALIVNIVANAIWVASDFGGLKDLDSFLHSGAAYARGLDPYQHYAWLQPEPISPEALNLNPPISVYLFEPLSSFNRGFVAAAFVVGSVAMVATAVGLLMRAYPDKRCWLVILVVASMAGIWHMLWYLQIYAPLLLAVAGAWLCLRNRQWVFAGILIGVVIAIKPNYALVPLILLAAGHARPAAASIVTVGAISLVPLLIDGPAIYSHWLHMTMEFEGYAWTSNASLVSVGERVDFAAAGQLAAIALGLGAVVLARRARPNPLDAMALGLMTVILVGPVSWAGYTLLLLPFLFSMRWDSWTWTAVLILATPFAPGRAFDSMGVELPSVLGASAHVSLAPVPSAVFHIVSALVIAAVGALYAWAVGLLLARHVQRILTESGLSLGVTVPPLRLRQSMANGLNRLRPSDANDAAISDVAPVRVRYDA